MKRIIPCLDVDKGRVVKGVQYVDLFASRNLSTWTKTRAENK